MPAIVKNRSYRLNSATANDSYAAEGRSVHQPRTFYPADQPENAPTNAAAMYQSSSTHQNQHSGASRQPPSATCSPTSSNSSAFEHQLAPNAARASNGSNEYKPYNLMAHNVDQYRLAAPNAEYSTPGTSNAAVNLGSGTAALPPGAQCAICGDKATGKHYGAQSCDGCKGFFRRSVRKNQQYRCRFQRACQIDKDKRNQCRSCRLAKCFRAGMRKEAVQNERDKIGSKGQSNANEGGSPDLDQNAFGLQLLQHAEMMSRRVCYELANGGLNGPATNGGRPPANDEQEFVATAMQSQRIAGASDIVDAMHRQLLVLVEWSKAIPCFMTELSLEDQITMLRAHAGDHLLIGVTKRSLVLNDTLLLANGAIIPRDMHAESEIYKIANRIIDELVRPMQELAIDDNECTCLKAIVFFDPSARGLIDSSRIRAWRHQVMLTLNDYVRERAYDASLPVSTPAGRFGELMMLIPVLQNLSMLMVEQLQLYKVLGGAKVNSLLQEMLFGVAGASANRMSSNEATSCITPPPSVTTQPAATQRGGVNNTHTHTLQQSPPIHASVMRNVGTAHMHSHSHSHASSSNQTPFGVVQASNAVSMGNGSLSHSHSHMEPSKIERMDD